MITVQTASFSELDEVHRKIPEFPDRIAHGFYEQNLKHRLFLALVAEVNHEVAGFKVAYQSESPEVLYSWMGGVLPEFRKTGVANALAEYQENWAKENGFKRVFFKTRNRFPAMIKFGLSRNFKIIEVLQKGGVQDYRIVMMKDLL